MAVSFFSGLFGAASIGFPSLCGLGAAATLVMDPEFMSPQSRPKTPPVTPQRVRVALAKKDMMTMSDNARCNGARSTVQHRGKHGKGQQNHHVKRTPMF